MRKFFIGLGVVFASLSSRCDLYPIRA
jgi:hypothetical protein